MRALCAGYATAAAGERFPGSSAGAVPAADRQCPFGRFIGAAEQSLAASTACRYHTGCACAASAAPAAAGVL